MVSVKQLSGTRLYEKQIQLKQLNFELIALLMKRTRNAVEGLLTRGNVSL